MRTLLFVLTTVILVSGFVLQTASGSRATLPSAALRQTPAKSNPGNRTLQPNSLCARDEQIIFSCAIKRSAKLVSLCASRELTKDHGYLQYRFGLPDKIELEFPKTREGTQQKFRYSHYFRFQVDLTEIKFASDGYEYSIFDEYNGEEKPATSSQGVSVKAPGKPKDVTIVCRSKPKADYARLQDVLASDEQ